MDLSIKSDRVALCQLYQRTLLDDVIPFWLRHGMDHEHGGIVTALDRDGTWLDSDKSVWFQGRAGWMFASLYLSIEQRPEWLSAAQSCAEFSLKHCHSPEGKMYFSVTRDGRPLRMRRYVYSESFAAISYASLARITGETRWREAAIKAFATYLRYSFEPGAMLPKYEPTRPMIGIGAHMIGLVTAQEMREHLGDLPISGKSCTEWIDASVALIRSHFLKPELKALMEVVAPDGQIIDHLDGRTLNPGHAIECAWFLMKEGRLRSDKSLVELGCQILDWMWERGWDCQHGGLLYFTDIYGKPVQEYWQDMKFWWPHCEALIATTMAWKLTGESRYANWHQEVHDWSFKHFSDPEHGEWYGYLHRDGTIAQPAKGNLFKGPFHLPRALWLCAQELEDETPSP